MWLITAKKESEVAEQQKESSKEASEPSQDSSSTDSTQQCTDGTVTQSPEDENTYIYCAHKNEGLQDNCQQTQPPNKGEESKASTTSTEMLDHAEDAPSDSSARTIGENEEFCDAKGAACTATGEPFANTRTPSASTGTPSASRGSPYGTTGIPAADSSSEHVNQQSADSTNQAETASSETDVPNTREPYEGSSHDETNSEATKTENSESSQLTNDPSLVNEQNIQSNDEAMEEKDNEDAKDRT